MFTLIGSWFVKYPDIITAKATITSVNPPERLESRVNSRITRIYVSNSEKVKKGDVLAILESTANYQDVIKLSKAIQAINTNYQTFTFPFDRLKSLQLGEIQTASIQFHKAYIENELNQKLHPYSQEINAGLSSQDVNSNGLSSLYAQQKLELAKLLLSEQQLKRSQQLFDKGVISGYDLEIQKVSNLQAKQNYDQTNLAISQQNYQFIAVYDGVFRFQNSWKENQMIKTADLFATILPENQQQFVGKLNVLSQNSGKI